jgi:flagellar basal-body rod protein FlgF
MLRGIYSVASAMETAARNHEIISENLVNATTPGYRRQGLLYESSVASFVPFEGTTPPPETASAQRPPSYQYFEPGAVQQTGNSLDLAVHGNAFFVVQGPNGPLYTRNGSFERGADGALQTRGGGYRVGGITLPNDGGTITVAPDGTVSANGASIGRLELATFSDPQSLRRVGPTLFEGGSPQPPSPNSVQVEQGAREGSNVQPVQEMVAMMVGMRIYEAAGKAMQALSDAISQNTKAQGNGA